MSPLKYKHCISVCLCVSVCACARVHVCILETFDRKSLKRFNMSLLNKRQNSQETKNYSGPQNKRCLGGLVKVVSVGLYCADNNR